MEGRRSKKRFAFWLSHENRARVVALNIRRSQHPTPKGKQERAHDQHWHIDKHCSNAENFPRAHPARWSKPVAGLKMFLFNLEHTTTSPAGRRGAPRGGCGRLRVHLGVF